MLGHFCLEGVTTDLEDCSPNEKGKKGSEMFSNSNRMYSMHSLEQQKGKSNVALIMSGG